MNGEMKSVLASIKPKYCELIASGRKTVELRKNCPKIDVPFKVYMYQTKGHWIYKILEWLNLYQGKVIGEFICDNISSFYILSNEQIDNWSTGIRQSCLSESEIVSYIGNGKIGYCWHISDLVIYDNPKELSDFLKYNRTEDDCNYQHLPFLRPKNCQECKECALNRPPQSWCYVEEVS